MESFFKAQVTAVAASIEEITRRSGGFDVGSDAVTIFQILDAHIFKSLLLVGGFAESSYLRTALDERLRVRQITIDSPTCVCPLLSHEECSEISTVTMQP